MNMTSDQNPRAAHPYRGPMSIDRRLIPIALGLVLAFLFAVLTTMTDADSVTRLAVGVPLFTVFGVWATVYAISVPADRRHRAQVEAAKQAADERRARVQGHSH